jgi:hypothetical protein
VVSTCPGVAILKILVFLGTLFCLSRHYVIADVKRKAGELLFFKEDPKEGRLPLQNLFQFFSGGSFL